MSDTKPLSDGEVRKLVKDLTKVILPISAKLTGEKPEPFSVDHHNEMVELMKSILDFSQTQQQKEDLLKNIDLPDQIKLKKQVELFDEGLRFFYRLISGEDVDNPASELLNVVNPKNSYEKSIDEQCRIKIRTPLHQIITGIAQMEKLGQINEFIKTMRMEDVFAHSQSAVRMNEKNKYLLKTRKRLTKIIVEKYIEGYVEISGFIEPLIVILYGLKQILGGKFKNFPDIRAINVGNLVNQLKADSLFNPLLDTYNPSIRNSIMHRNYHVDPLSRTIEFVDIDKKFSLSYKEFIDYVQEILKRVIVISHIEQEVNYLALLWYVERRKQILSQP